LKETARPQIRLWRKKKKKKTSRWFYHCHPYHMLWMCILMHSYHVTTTTICPASQILPKIMDAPKQENKKHYAVIEAILDSFCFMAITSTLFIYKC
jgi:hypothetical protein